MPVIGVVGPRALVDRLGCSLRVRRLLPTDAPVEDVDAVLVARSAFTSGGSWAAALRPVGFDRGVALATALADARAAGVPVVLLEDLPVTALDGWETVLDGAVDDGLTLGPLGAGDVGWNPGEHWDATALRLAVARPPGRPADPAGVAATAARGNWHATQREGAARGRVDIDVADPWSRHLASELVGLGADVRDATTGAPVPRDGATPTAATTWLCARLGLSVPEEGQTDATTRLLQDGAGGRESAACLAALDRVCQTTAVVLRVGGTIAATTDVAAATQDAERDGLLVATALDLEALA